MKLLLKISVFTGLLLISYTTPAQVTATDAGKRSTLHSLALSGEPASLPVIEKAAKSAGYKPDPSGALSSLLLYASSAEKKGDSKLAEKAVSLIIKNCTVPETDSIRIVAMRILSEVNPDKAVNVLLKTVDDKDPVIRDAVVKLANNIPGSGVTEKWINRYGKVTPKGKISVLKILGLRGDEIALPLVRSAMEEKNQDISGEAVSSLAKLIKGEAADPILTWLTAQPSEQAHIKAADVLVTILNHDNIGKVAEALRTSKGHATATLIYLLSWSGDIRFFDAVFPYTNSGDIPVRAAAFSALKSLASGKDIDNLLTAINRTDERPEVLSIQDAMAVATERSGDEPSCTGKILEAIKNGTPPAKLVPVLALTGGKEALDYVLEHFDNGNPEMRELCFDALQGWHNSAAFPVLFAICTSGNETYSKPALDACIRLASDTLLDNSQKIALYEKIAPYAIFPDSREEMVVRTGFIKTKAAFDFLSGYLNDTDSTVVFCSALAITNITLPSAGNEEGLRGGDIYQTLRRILTILTGDDYKDTREKINRYLNKQTGN